MAGVKMGVVGAFISVYLISMKGIGAVAGWIALVLAIICIGISIQLGKQHEELMRAITGKE